MSGDARMRSKRELIERFIQENMPHIKDPDDIPDRFTEFWSKERISALENLIPILH